MSYYKLLSDITVGETLILKEDNYSYNYIVVHQGLPSDLYDNSCNGTWLLREETQYTDPWNSSGVNTLENSNMFTYLNTSVLNEYDSAIQTAIKQVKIPYRKNGGSSGSDQTKTNGLECKIFPLSGREVGFTDNESPNLPNDGAKLDYFDSGNTVNAKNKRIAKEGVTVQNKPIEWWLRSPNTNNNTKAFKVMNDGSLGSERVEEYGYYRPALILPSNMVVGGNFILTSVPSIKSIIVPSIAMQGESIPLSWDNNYAGESVMNFQLQRKADNGDWITIYTGSNASYTDTAGVWTSVQYQVAIVIEGGFYPTGPYTQSTIVPVSSPAALVISGSDGDLGTLTSDLPYTVSSNISDSISLTRIVNGTRVATLNIGSGFAYSIPITDLPTGSGTIAIEAQIQNIGTGQIKQTRTWTYYKTPIDIPSTGGIAQLVQNNQNIWPATLADCVKVPTFFGGTLDKALELIAPAVNPAVIAAGSYTGNGQFGQSHPNTLTFSKQPLIVIIYGPNTTLSISSTDTSSTAYISGTTATWYSTENAEAQLNSLGIEYSYVAIATTNN